MQDNVLIAYSSDELKKLIPKFDKGIAKFLSGCGIGENDNYSGFSIHHMITKQDKVIHHDIDNEVIKILKKALPYIGNENKLREVLGTNYNTYELFIEELEEIVLIPTWFHNYLHRNKVDLNTLNSREDYYKLLKEVYLKKKKLKEIKFNDNNIYSALKSIEKVVVVTNFTKDEKTIGELKRIFNRIRRQDLFESNVD